MPASSSSSSGSGLASKVHLQAPKAKRFTPATKQKNDLNEKILCMLQQEENRPIEQDDELDLMFAGYAKRMRLFLSNEQKEDVMQQVHNVITQGINNARAGMPVLQRAPVPPAIRVQEQASNVMQSNMQNLGPPPPTAAAPSTIQPGQQQQPFYMAGPTSMQYELQDSTYNLKDL